MMHRYDEANRAADVVLSTAARIRNMLGYGMSREDIRDELKHSDGLTDETIYLAFKMAKLMSEWS